MKRFKGPSLGLQNRSKKMENVLYGMKCKPCMGIFWTAKKRNDFESCYDYPFVQLCNGNEDMKEKYPGTLSRLQELDLHYVTKRKEQGETQELKLNGNTKYHWNMFVRILSKSEMDNSKYMLEYLCKLTEVRGVCYKCHNSIVKVFQ